MRIGSVLVICAMSQWRELCHSIHYLLIIKIFVIVLLLMCSVISSSVSFYDVFLSYYFTVSEVVLVC